MAELCKGVGVSLRETSALTKILGTRVPSIFVPRDRSPYWPLMLMVEVMFQRSCAAALSGWIDVTRFNRRLHKLADWLSFIGAVVYS